MSLAAIGKLERGARQRPYRSTVSVLAEALSLAPGDRERFEGAASRLVSTAGDGPAIHLPVYFSSFVGREHDLRALNDLLERYRLITLAGAGGVGKTRLAVRAVEQHLAALTPHERITSVWFVDLSMLDDGDLVAPALAARIGAEHSRTIDALVDYLKTESFVLILDNCEHLVGSVVDVAHKLLAGCPWARIVVTSRQALSADGERVYRVPPLTMPDAIALFEERACANDNRFVLTGHATASVENICKRVDGIALAIELAAARTNAFSVETIAAQLAQRTSLLDGAGRTTRHKTMRALFDWSYDLLDEPERALFRRLSTFVDGFTLDLAGALDSESRRQDSVPPLLASLVDKSFVHCDILNGPRYRLLQAARQYALEKLRALNEYGEASRAHALALLSLADEFDSRLELVPDREWSERLEGERDNFRSAFEWALSRDGDAAIAQSLAASRSATWSGFGSGEARAWIARALETIDATTPGPAIAKLALANARAAIYFEHEPQVRIDACERAVRLQDPSDARALAAAECYAGLALSSVGRNDDATATLRRARDLALLAGAQSEYNRAITTLSIAAYRSGALDDARALLQEALLRSEAAGSERLSSASRVTLAEVEFAAGSIEAAIEHNERATKLFRRHSDLVSLATILSNSAAYNIVLGRYSEAADRAHEALRHSRKIGNVNSTFWAMQHLATVAVLSSEAANHRSRFARAAAVLGFVDQATRLRAKHRSTTEQQPYDMAMSALRHAFDDHELSGLLAEGRGWSEDRAAAEAFALEGLQPEHA
jgi:predicted ATPase